MHAKEKSIKTNPFPGLRPFSYNESHLFFGREGQSETILNYLSQYKFAAITGASGSGKSSLVYCGVIPLLYGGFIPEAGNDWEIITTRPGSTPVWNLAKSLAIADKQQFNGTENSITEYYYSLLRRHSHGLVESTKQLGFDSNKNILIVIDQFEELFRYKESRNNLENHHDEPETFIRLLVNTLAQTDCPVYIILTMRSDFIGDCSEFQGLTSLINKSNYLVPQMTRKDYEMVITGPIQVTGESIDPKLLQQILNSLDESHDQLPVLQHAMMRTWEFWQKHSSSNGPISLRDYLASGKMENALSLHANEAYVQLNDQERMLCKTIFKALTEKGKEGKGIRRPATIKDISILAQVQPTEVMAIVDAFRQPDRSFLTPNHTQKLSEESVIDITHESLMRVWDKLKAWVDEEASSSQMYLRLIELAGLYQLGRTGLMRPPDLHLASNWKKSQNPNRAWAKRYDPAFEKAMVYLNTSEKKFLAEEESRIKIRKRELNRSRRIALVSGIFAIVLLMLMFYAYLQRKDALEQKEKVEQYATILEAQKDTAVEISQLRTFELIKERDIVDSLARKQQMQLIQSEEVEQTYIVKLGELSELAEELEKTAAQEREDKQKAESEAQRALQDRTQIEVQRQAEKRLRMLTLSQTVALKAHQTDDNQLSGLLSYHAFLLNRENGGQSNHPEIYRSLYSSLRNLKGERYNTLTGHAHRVKSLLFDPSRNLLYSSDNSGVINRWSFNRNAPKPRNVLNNDKIITCIDLTVDGRWMACGTRSSSIQLFNTQQPTQAPRLFEGHRGKILKVKFIPGRNTLISSGSDYQVRSWNLLTNEETLIYENAAGISDIDVDPNGSGVIIATNSNAVIFHNIKTKNSFTLFQHSIPISSITFDHEGRQIAVGDQTGRLIVLNASNGAVIKKIKGHGSSIVQLRFSPDNRLLASSDKSGGIKIWNVFNWNNLPIEIREHKSRVEAIEFSPDGKNLLSTSNDGNFIYVWPIKSKQLIGEMCEHLSRQLTPEEWKFYMGNDLPYRRICEK